MNNRPNYNQSVGDVDLYKVTLTGSNVTWICPAKSEDEALDWVAQALNLSTGLLQVEMVPRREPNPEWLVATTRIALLVCLFCTCYLVSMLGRAANQGNPWTVWVVFIVGVAVGVWFLKLWKSL